MAPKQPPDFDDSTSLQVVQCLWPGLSKDEFNRMERQYSTLIDYIKTEFIAVSENSSLFALQSQDEVTSLIRSLRQLGPVPRHLAVEATSRIASHYHSPGDKVLRSLDSVVRMWLTIDITSSGLPRHGRLIWNDENTLKETVDTHFERLENAKVSDLPDGRLRPEITAESLVSNYGFTVSWTHNLLEHLDIDWKHRIILVYEHKILLQNGIRFPGCMPIAEAVLAEAIDTLNLLFPFQDDATRRFLQKHRKPFYGLGLCNRPRKLDLGEYRYWRSRVGDLQLICNGPPLGLQQLRLDKSGRNLLQFSTFWIATVVGVLTLIGFGIGIAAIYYGAKQYEIAVLQYELAVAQACLNPVADSPLSRFCA